MPSGESRAAADAPRIHCALALASGATLALPPAAARHVQVLRLQPGASLRLFDGAGGEYDALVVRMGRSDVTVQIGAHHAIEREAAREVHLAVGIPANERMDWLVEKATELGAASLQPLQVERSVVRLQADRAQKKREHWQAIAIAACEQCGRNRVPAVHEVRRYADWMASGARAGSRLLLSPQSARPLHERVEAPGAVCMLSGPEGGLTAAEEQLALDNGFTAVSLGPRVLRADTAPIAALALLALSH